MPKILVVDDDIRAVEDIYDWFVQEGHSVEVAYNGRDALQLMESFTFDVILLDWQLPDIPGLEICQRFRKNGGRSFVIFVTGQGDFYDKKQGFDAGCDDYVVKPFDIRELSLRIRTVLRRPIELLPVELMRGDVTLNVRNRHVVFNNHSVQLPPKELAVLEYLMRHPGVPFQAQALLDAIWPSDSAVSAFTVRTAIMTLRKNLAKIGLGDFVKTRSSLGYVVD